MAKKDDIQDDHLRAGDDTEGHGVSGRLGLGSDLPSFGASGRFSVNDTDDVTGHSAKAFKADDADEDADEDAAGDDTDGHSLKIG